MMATFMVFSDSPFAQHRKSAASIYIRYLIEVHLYYYPIIG
jgi:hypothetical protein